MKKTYFLLNVLIAVLLFGCFSLVNQALAWTEPTVAPPLGNASAPINVSSTKQIKDGALGLKGADPTTLYGLYVKQLSTAAGAAIRSEFSDMVGYVHLNSKVCPAGAGPCGIAVSYSDSYASGISVSGAGSAGIWSSSTGVGAIGVIATAPYIGLKATGGDLGIGVSAESNGTALSAINASIGATVRLGYIDNSKKDGTKSYVYGVHSNFPSGANAAYHPVAIYGSYDLNNYAEIGSATVGVAAKGSTTGVRGEYDILNYGELGANGVGVKASGSVTALRAEYANDVVNNYVTLADGSYGVFAKNTRVAGTAAIRGEYDVKNYAELGKPGYGIVADGDTMAGLFNGPVKISGNLTITGVCTGAGATCKVGDVAEYMAKSEPIEAGDIVSADSSLKLFKAIKSDKTVVGVVSTNPFMEMNKENYPDGAPLALTGLVDVKVTNENGKISAGDFITASSKPGFGMKAVEPATVIGKALEDFNGESGKIKVVLGLSWFAGENCQK